MEVIKYADQTADRILIQAVDDYGLKTMEQEIAQIRSLTNRSFGLIAIRVDDWNRDLSPWKAPAVFGKEDFGGDAGRTLLEVQKVCTDQSKTYYIGGYSLAGLFALWAACETDLFAGVAAASPSVWYPGFVDYIKKQKPKCNTVYLSLGDREEKTKNQVMGRVGDCIRECYAFFSEWGTDCTLEWNPGNHFRDADLRTARAFGSLLGGGCSNR
ncbi:MAG: esterase [Lachnospiraceae bacterium]|nr:esterase [Lachnospiraceae bacterium]